MSFLITKQKVELSMATNATVSISQTFSLVQVHLEHTQEVRQPEGVLLKALPLIKNIM